MSRGEAPRCCLPSPPGDRGGGSPGLAPSPRGRKVRGVAGVSPGAPVWGVGWGVGGEGGRGCCRGVGSHPAPLPGHRYPFPRGAPPRTDDQHRHPISPLPKGARSPLTPRCPQPHVRPPAPTPCGARGKGQSLNFCKGSFESGVDLALQSWLFRRSRPPGGGGGSRSPSRGRRMQRSAALPAGDAERLRAGLSAQMDFPDTLPLPTPQINN